MQVTHASDPDESTFGSINYIKSSGAKLALLGEPSHTVIKCLTPSKTIEKYNEATQSRQEALATIIRLGAKATICMLSDRYKYYYLACPCCLGCGCYNRTKALCIPILRCYGDEEIDNICQIGILRHIGYETLWFCKKCKLPTSCGIAKPKCTDCEFIRLSI